MGKIILTLLMLSSLSQAGVGEGRLLVVLPGSDTSGMNLGAALQGALVKLYQSNSSFQVQFSAQPLSGFSPEEIQKTHAIYRSDALSFAYLEKDKIAVFIFDYSRPQEFIVGTEIFKKSDPSASLSSAQIEGAFVNSFNQAIAFFNRGEFQPLPGAKLDDQTLAAREKQEIEKRASESRQLFRDLTQTSFETYFAGMSIGMARFGAADYAASSVNLGFLGGMNIFNTLKWELGIDLFTFALGHSELRYSFQLGNKQFTIGIDAGVGYTLANLVPITQGSSVLRVGDIVFGPGLSIDIPLLGATLRGDIRYYFGQRTVLLGSYGLAYEL